MKKMIKDLSQSLDRRRKGIRNATWDLVFLYQWLKCSDNQAKENTLWLGASDDKALKRIGRRLLVSGDASEDAIAANLRALLEEEWGHERGSTIFAKYSELQKDKENPRRPAKLDKSVEYWNQFTIALERAVGI